MDFDDKSGIYQNSILAMSNSNMLSNSYSTSNQVRFLNKDSSANIGKRVSK